jgi:UDP-glucose 6-dehydrogenase
MKLGVNNFYAVKIQFFNEIYLLSKKLDISFDIVRDTMIKNNWINPMHTIVPGNDGKLSYGGECFPKDTNALNQFMIKNNIPNGVLNSTINERNLFRNE